MTREICARFYSSRLLCKFSSTRHGSTTLIDSVLRNSWNASYLKGLNSFEKQRKREKFQRNIHPFTLIIHEQQPKGRQVSSELLAAGEPVIRGAGLCARARQSSVSLSVPRPNIGTARLIRALSDRMMKTLTTGSSSSDPSLFTRQRLLYSSTKSIVGILQSKARRCQSLQRFRVTERLTR